MKSMQYTFAEWQSAFLPSPPHFPLKILYVTTMNVCKINDNPFLIIG